MNEIYELREIEVSDVHLGIQKYWALFHDERQLCIFFRGTAFDLEEWEEVVHWMNVCANRQSEETDYYHLPARPMSPNHALLVGMTAGALSQTLATALVETPADLGEIAVEIMDDEEGNHLDTFRVRRNSGSYLVTVRPEVTWE